MKRENRNIKIQARISQSEKDMLNEMALVDREFSISKFVRKAIDNEYKKRKGIGKFKVG